MSSANKLCTTSPASSRLHRMRSALRRSAGANFLYASSGSVADSTRDADVTAGAELALVVGSVGRTVRVLVAQAPIGLADLERPLAAAGCARAVGVVEAGLAALAIAAAAVRDRRVAGGAGRSVGAGALVSGTAVGAAPAASRGLGALRAD